jgi:hypothetical protein
VKASDFEAWSAVRARGMLRYTLLSGIVSYGVPMFVVMTFFVRSEPKTLGFLSLSAAIWVVGGAIFGITMWHYNEWRYRKAAARTEA